LNVSARRAAVDEHNTDIAKAESLADQRHGDLEAACKQLDGMAPELMALSKQMAERSAPARATDRLSVAASGR
jgi:hypothetical protein